MTPEQFFEGRLRGYGVARSLTGRVLRRFTVEMHGVWSEEHRALHMDEVYRYVDGMEGEFHRHWAIHTDEEGFILGHDAREAARMRGRQRGRDFRIVFDREGRGPLGRLDPPQVVDFLEAGPDACVMYGRVKLFGLTIATIHVGLKREAAA